MKKWAARLSKIGFMLFALLAIVLTIMVNMGGNSETLKGALEDYLTQAGGGKASITTLNKMTFYPHISIDIEGIKLESGVTAESAKVSLSFWDMIYRRQRFRALDIENIQFPAGALLEKPLVIDEMGLDEDAQGRAFLTLEGALDGEVLSFSIDLERQGKKFGLGDESPFVFFLSDFGMNGTLRQRTLGGFHMRDMTVTHKEQDILKGTLSFVRDAGTILDLEGDLLIPEHGTKTALDVDVVLGKTHEMTGSMNADFLAAADFGPTTRLAEALAAWNALIPPRGKATIMLDIKAINFARDGQHTKDYEGQLIREGDALIFKP